MVTIKNPNPYPHNTNPCHLRLNDVVSKLRQLAYSLSQSTDSQVFPVQQQLNKLAEELQLIGFAVRQFEPPEQPPLT